MSRPAIPAEIRRAVLVEAGHRCAIPRCGNTELDIHHIIPWETCKTHEYSNLIALCPVCHRRAHNGEIDRKSLQLYKENLVKEFGSHDNTDFKAEIVEVRRRLKEINDGMPGFHFEFDFPDFQTAAERIVSKNIEAWGYELLTELREMQDNVLAEDAFLQKGDLEYRPPKNSLEGSYQVVRRDDKVISIKYNIDRYYSGAAHGGRTTLVQNFSIRPFRPITLDYLLGGTQRLQDFASFIRSKLAHQKDYDSSWLESGTEPKLENFSLFNIHKYALEFTFSEYQIDCFAAGEQRILIGFHELNAFISRDILQSLEVSDL